MVYCHRGNLRIHIDLAFTIVEDNIVAHQYAGSLGVGHNDSPFDVVVNRVVDNADIGHRAAVKIVGDPDAVVIVVVKEIVVDGDIAHRASSLRSNHDTMQ